MTFDAVPWTPDTVRQALEGRERERRTFVQEIERHVRGQVATMMLRCECLRRQGHQGRDDFVQTVLMRLVEADFKRLRAWRGEPAYLWGYVWGFSRNVVREACKKCRGLEPDREPELEPRDPRPDPCGQFEEREVVEAAVDELRTTISERSFLVFWESDIEGKSHAAIGEALKITTNNVSQYLHHARARLKEIVPWPRGRRK